MVWSVAGRFAYSKPSRRGPNDPWFRIGTLDIGSAALLSLMCVVSVIIYAIEPIDKPILLKLALIPNEVTSGQVWRVLTWPLANGLDQALLWVIVAVLVGMVSWAFGLTSFVSGGMRDIAQTIVDGRLDLHLGRPCHPLPTLLLSRSVPAGIGDLLSAFVFWFWLGDRTLGELPLLLVMATAAAIVVCATTVIIQCLVFWRPQAIALCEELFNTLLMVAYYPQHPFGLTVRIVLFTVFPAAFVAFLPAEAIRHPEAINVLGMLGAALIYSLLAVAVFNRGLRRYASGNGVLELH